MFDKFNVFNVKCVFTCFMLLVFILYAVFWFYFCAASSRFAAGNEYVELSLAEGNLTSYRMFLSNY